MRCAAAALAACLASGCVTAAIGVKAFSPPPPSIYPAAYTPADEAGQECKDACAKTLYACDREAGDRNSRINACYDRDSQCLGDCFTARGGEYTPLFDDTEPKPIAQRKPVPSRPSPPIVQPANIPPTRTGLIDPFTPAP